MINIASHDDSTKQQSAPIGPTCHRVELNGLKNVEKLTSLLLSSNNMNNNVILAS